MRHPIATLISLALLGFLSSDLAAQQNSVRVGYLPATHDLLLFIAQEERLFPGGLNVIATPYKNSGDILRDLAAQRLDLGIPGVAAPLNFISSGHEFTIIAGAAAESAAIIVPEAQAKQFLTGTLNERLQRFANLKVGTVRQSTGDALFRKAIAEAKPTLTGKVDIGEYTDPNALLAALRNQFIHAAVLWSPHMSIAESTNPKMKIVLWLREILPQHVCCRQVVHDSFLKAHRNSVVFYLAGLIRAMKFYQDPRNRQRVLAIARTWLPQTPPEILEIELFPSTGGSPPRTSVSVDLNDKGLHQYIDAMKPVSGYSKQQLVAIDRKIDASVLSDSYQYLGMSREEAAACVGGGFALCPAKKLK